MHASLASIGSALSPIGKFKTSDAGDLEEPLVPRRKHMLPASAAHSVLLQDYLVAAERLANPNLGSATTDPDHAHDKLELKHVAVWIVVLQVVFACASCALTSAVVPSLLPPDGMGAVRTLLASGLVGAAILVRPFLVVEGGKVQAVDPLLRVYKSLRLALAIVLAAWVVEALLHTDCHNEPGAQHHIGALRHGVIAVAYLTALVAGWCRALFPTSRSDLQVVVALCAAGVMLCAPQTMDMSTSPLLRKLSLADGAIRVTRVVLFSLTYCGIALAVMPQFPHRVEPLVVATRALAGSVWILLGDAQFLFCAPLFCLVLCVRRAKAQATPEHEHLEYKNLVNDSNEDEDDVISIVGDLQKAAAARPLAAVDGPHSSLSEERKRQLMQRLGGSMGA